MKTRDTSISGVCKDLGVTRRTLYRYVGPDGTLRKHGRHVLENNQFFLV
ncbi:MAG: hypothetical protein ACI9ES_002036 [Oceanospirillaceae bacterium]|jgi:hypothetical protein